MSKFTDHLGRPVVAVTGIGIITSLGVGRAENWQALTSGRSGIRAITRFPTDGLRTRISGMVDFLASSSDGPGPLTHEMAETTALEAWSVHVVAVAGGALHGDDHSLRSVRTAHPVHPPTIFHVQPDLVVPQSFPKMLHPGVLGQVTPYVKVILQGVSGHS